MTHGRMEEAERSWRRSRRRCESRAQERRPVDDSQVIELTPEKRYGDVVFLGWSSATTRSDDPGASLMITQSFLYNAIYFTYGRMLVQFYGMRADRCPMEGPAFAVGNLLRPLIPRHSSTAWAGSR